MSRKSKTKQIVASSEEEDEDMTTSDCDGDRISWVGKPVYTEDEKEFHHAVNIDGTIYYLKEYISLKLPTKTKRPQRRVTRRMAKGDVDEANTHIMVFGHLQHLWETKNGDKMCQINEVWVRPEDTPSGRMPYHGEKELVKNDAVDAINEVIKPIENVFAVGDAPQKVIVETFDKFSRRKDFPDNVYYIRTEKLLEPKIELASPAKKKKSVAIEEKESEHEASEEEHPKPELKRITRAASKQQKHNKSAEEPDTHADATPPSPSTHFDLATPSPSKRKNLQLISDEGDYNVVVKNESEDVRSTRQLKRFVRKLEMEDEVPDDDETQPEDPDAVSTPKKRRRIITDSDDEDEDFATENATPTRRSTRIPTLQHKKSTVRSILGKEDSGDEASAADEQESGSERGGQVASDGSEEDSMQTTTVDQETGKETVDLTSDTEKPPQSKNDKKPDGSSSSCSEARGKKAGMSWIELSERGKLAAPTLKPTLQFNTTTKTGRKLRTRQSNINEFLVDETQQNFIDLVEREERSGNSKPKTPRSTKKSNKDLGESFIPELMFADNDVDDDFKKHLKQQKLMHEFKRHAAEDEEKETTGGGGRWGRSKKARTRTSTMDYESDPEENNEEYETDDWLVADDAPIETYSPSQEEMEDEDDGSVEGDADGDEEDGDEDDEVTIPTKNDQDGLFEHVFTQKEAFNVFLQYLTSACADPDFIPLMVSEHQETYFRPALRKIRDQIRSRKASLVQSSAWDASFKESLETRPFYASYGTTNITLEDCHACLRANHPASWKVNLSGPVYNPDKYLNGNNVLDIPILPEQNRDLGEDAYLLGSFCHTRTSLYHRLHFFHIHMYEKVKNKVELESDDDTSPENLVQSLMDNGSWVGELADRFSNLLKETDDFMNDTDD